MNLGKEINQATKTTLVFAVITGIFTLLQKLSALVLIGESNASFKVSMEHFVKVNLLWFIAVVLIILGLYIFIKKTDGIFNLTFLHNPTIRLTVGLLILFEGIINLSNKIPVLILNIQTFRHATSLLGDDKDKIMSGFLTSDSIPIVTNLLLTLLGLYFVLNRKKMIEQP